MILTGKSQSIQGGGTFSVPLCPKQTPHRRVWNRTRFSAVKGPTYKFLTMALAWHQCYQGSHTEKNCEKLGT